MPDTCHRWLRAAPLRLACPLAFERPGCSCLEGNYVTLQGRKEKVLNVAWSNYLAQSVDKTSKVRWVTESQDDVEKNSGLTRTGLVDPSQHVHPVALLLHAGRFHRVREQVWRGFVRPSWLLRHH